MVHFVGLYTNILLFTLSTFVLVAKIFCALILPEKIEFCIGVHLFASLQLVAKLTKDIVETYQLCNSDFKYSEELNPKRFLTSPSIGVLNDGHDNVNSDLILAVNSVLVNTETQRRLILLPVIIYFPCFAWLTIFMYFHFLCFFYKIKISLIVLILWYLHSYFFYW